MIDHYYSYLLRIFRPGANASPWKITLQNTLSLETLDFATLLELHNFLARLIEDRERFSDFPPREGTNPDGGAET